MVMVKVIEVAKLPEKAPVPVAVGTKALLVVKDGDKIYVADGICPHGRWLLSLGTYRDGHLTCKGHGTVYNLETGEGELKGYKYYIRTYEAVIKDGAVYVEI
ncbi:Ferredoxin subunits of nitrite reductase and ring-hydroxylating dioxygenase [Pyrobaculum oguniense TE7]|uniref:Ferredoxin subunits of nitrite reductase and ring-hydroxylating dioxygenase n=1 Tax=Pyrobaculum oguniense (strain DSM 13380 / JCM 10595 / TE7) TaxID=698757 RepID=H6Q9G1_PYROT|nr:Ferredoxin subunits of nitrite reductase and ring-hydroxylating dioxygenase [Pyrobaculum oguniense TE7]